MINELLYPPRLRSGDHEKNRRSTWLELFYDLVFAVAIYMLGEEVRTHSTWTSIVKFVLLSIPVWWAWVGHTLYSTRFDTDDLIHRLLTFSMMLAAGVMAAQIPYAFRGQVGGFAGAYVAMRLVLIAFYLRAIRHVPEARDPAKMLLLGLGLSGVIWLVSAFVPAPEAYVLWGVGMFLDLLTPVVAQEQSPLPAHTSHLPERFGLFTLIVMGYGVYTFIQSIEAHPDQPWSLLALSLAMVIALAMWWLYFGYLSLADEKFELGTGFGFVYWHLPLVLSMVGVAAALASDIHDVALDSLPIEKSALLFGSSALWLLSFGAIRVASIGYSPRVRKKLRIYATGVVLCGLGMLLATKVDPMWTLAYLTAVFVGLAIHATIKDPAVDPKPSVLLIDSAMAEQDVAQKHESYLS